MTEPRRETHEIRSRVVSGMPMADYHAVKALSASGIHALVEECPARFWHDSPWGPGQPERAPHFDIGTALHLAVLEPAEFDRRVVRIEQDDYRTKEARDRRDEAWATGCVPLKAQELALVEGMAASLRERPEIAALFRGGQAEVSLFWDWDGIPCKARPDYLSADRRTIVDAKSAESAHPDAIARKVWAEGWHIRDAWYREGVARCFGVEPERYVFVVFEKSPPHLIQAYVLDERAVEWGRQLIRRGLRLFAECRCRKRWPGYGEGIMSLSLPSWSEYRLAERDEAGWFSNRITAEQSRFGRELLAP